MNTNPPLTEAELNAPLYDETVEILIPYEPANAKYQDLIQRHKSLGCRLHHDTRRIALALAQRIRTDGAKATDWELALMEDAGLTRTEMS